VERSWHAFCGLRPRSMNTTMGCGSLQTHSSGEFLPSATVLSNDGVFDEPPNSMPYWSIVCIYCPAPARPPAAPPAWPWTETTFRNRLTEAPAILAERQ
jgi:hypothetical protein